MTADSIRKLIDEHLGPRLGPRDRTTLDEAEIRNILLAEIAAQLAELNTKLSEKRDGGI